MPEHPIETLIKTSMESIREMVDVNTILGDAVETPDGSVIVPVSRVTFGFAAGGSEFVPGSSGKDQRGGDGTQSTQFPFGRKWCCRVTAALRSWLSQGAMFGCCL